jgi:hypothetical protein
LKGVSLIYQEHSACSDGQDINELKRYQLILGNVNGAGWQLHGERCSKRISEKLFLTYFFLCKASPVQARRIYGKTKLKLETDVPAPPLFGGRAGSEVQLIYLGKNPP